MGTSIRGADVVVQTLRQARVQKIFTLSGNQIMPLFDACVGSSIQLIHVRHEAAAVHMADAWGRLTNQAGIALVTAGPGHANCMGALYTALAAESPLVLLSGHAPLNQLGKGAFQEMPQAELAAKVCKAAWTVQSAEQLGQDLERALHIAVSGRPGPVQLNLPFDLLQTTLPSAVMETAQKNAASPTPLTLDASTNALVREHLAQAARPLILTGPALQHGGGRKTLATLAQTSNIPIISMESPRGINDPSSGRLAEVLGQADVIFLLGKALDFTLRFGTSIAADCKFLQIDSDADQLAQTQRNLDDPTRLLRAVQADPRACIKALLSPLKSTNKTWFDEVQTALAYRPPAWQTLPSAPEQALHPVELCQAVQAMLDSAAAESSILIADGGEFGQWAQACLRADYRIINGPAGSIGGAVPFALAAKLAFPKATVVAMLGDGTCGFHLAEFDTAVRYQIPILAIIGNDACWNAEYQIQLRDYGADRLIGCELRPSRYDQVMSALGGYGDHVQQLPELLPALEKARHVGQAACINVALQRQPAPLY